MTFDQPRKLRPASPLWLSLTLLLGCLALHGIALMWIDDATSRQASGTAWRRPPVQASLLPEPPRPAPPEKAAPAAQPEPKPAPRPARPAPVARPKPPPRAPAVPITPVPPGPPAGEALDPVAAPADAPVVDPEREITAAAAAPPGDGAAGRGAGATGDRAAADGAGANAGSGHEASDAATQAAMQSHAQSLAAQGFGPLPPLPEGAQMRFTIHLGNYVSSASVAQLQYTLEHHDGRYTVRSQGEATGLTSLFYRGVLRTGSSGASGSAGLAPEQYTEQRGSGGERWARIDYKTRQVSFSSGDTSTLVDGAQDRLSALLQLGLMARASPQRFAQGKLVELPEVNLRSLDITRYRSAGDETLRVASGELRTLKLVREPLGGDREAGAEIWLGYDQSMLPVRIRLTDKGGRTIDQILVPDASQTK